MVTRRTIFELRKARDRAHILKPGDCAGEYRPDYRTDSPRVNAGRSKSGADFASVDLGNVKLLRWRARR
ncbi:hypothetical protein KCP69_11565 [Salmonella enterica subsp. enterica]|nr:hypothetical protein KCP69_11565 [Salmonella enterica subsp. enterica]